MYRIVLHSLDVTKRNPCTDLVVYWCDIDVRLLLLYYFCELCSSTIFRTTNREICLRTLPSHLGPELCTSLLGFHALTGCDQLDKFTGFTKKTCWKALVDVSPDVSSAFRSVGQCEISDEIKAGLEESVLNLYCKDRPSDVNTLGSLRWYLFSRYVILAFLLHLGTTHLWYPHVGEWWLKYFLRKGWVGRTGLVVVTNLVIFCGLHKCMTPCSFFLI